jgi:hypothetical protein
MGWIIGAGVGVVFIYVVYKMVENKNIPVTSSSNPNPGGGSDQGGGSPPPGDGGGGDGGEE